MFVAQEATVLPRLGIEPGAVLDTTTCDERGVPWGFTKDEMKEKAGSLKASGRDQAGPASWKSHVHKVFLVAKDQSPQDERSAPL